jgi:NADH-quinone oxidoreductase subunit C
VYQKNPAIDQLVSNKLNGQFHEAIEKQEFFTDMVCFTVRKESIIDILKFLHSDSDLDYNFLTTLCGMHYPEKEQLGVVYHLHSFANNHRIRIKTAFSIENPVIETATSIWPAANWMERETYDFYGILFEGHPNLKRILNVDEMTDFPMRKDFPLEDQTREDKDDTMFGR